MADAKKLFYTPEEVGTMFNMTSRQVYRHAHMESPGFPKPSWIGDGAKKTLRFSVEETGKCVWKAGR